ncbi:MAG TPA: GAF domain-containing protein, partial [Acidimicrobiia bacterium]
MFAQPRPGAGAGDSRPAVSNRALVASVVACTVAIFAFDFIVMTLASGSLRTGGERAARAMPFISLAAVVVLLLLRRQLRSRQAMIAELQRSRLGAEHARRQLALVAQGTRALVTSVEDQTAALQSLAGAIVPEFADWCAVDLVEDGAVRRVAAAHALGLDARHPDLLERHPGWASVVRRVMAAGRGELAWVGQPAPAAPDDADHLAVMEVLGLRSWVCVPLRIQGLSVGAISLGTGEDRRGFRPSDLAAAEELAGRTGVAIERIALYRESQRAAQDAERRAEQLRRLVEAALAVPPRPGVRDVAGVVSEQACRVLGAGLALVVVDAGDERITAAAGGTWGEEHDRLLAEAEGAELGAAMCLRDPTSGAVRAVATRLGGRQGRPAGMLAVAQPSAGGFTSDDESILVLLAQMASVAVDNAHLYETVRAREEHLRALVEAAPLAILEFGVDAGLRQANTAARELLGPAGDGPEAEAFHPVTAGVLRQVVGDTVAGAAVSGAEAVACRADGTEVALSLFGAALLDA